MALFVCSILLGLLSQQTIAQPLLGSGGADVGNILGGLGLNGLLGSGGTLNGILGSTCNMASGSAGGGNDASDQDCGQQPSSTSSTPVISQPSPFPCFAPTPAPAPITPSFSFAPVPQPVPVRIPASSPQSVTIPNIIVALLPPTPKGAVRPQPVRPFPVCQPRPVPLCQPQPIVVPVPQPRLVPIYETACGC